MPHLTSQDLASRALPVAKGFKKRTADFHPGGEKGKLHRELGVLEDEKIPQERLAAAEHSDNPETRRDAIRAKTMEGWNHGGGKSRMPYTHSRGGRG